MNISVFSSFKIVLVIVAFLGIDLLMIFLMAFVSMKAAFGVLNSEVGRNVKSAIKYLV